MAHNHAGTVFETVKTAVDPARVAEDFAEQAFRTAFSMSEVMQHSIERNTQLLGAMQGWFDQNTKLLGAVQGWFDQNARLLETMQRAAAHAFRPLQERDRA